MNWGLGGEGGTWGLITGMEAWGDGHEVRIHLGFWFPACNVEDKCARARQRGPGPQRGRFLPLPDSWVGQSGATEARTPGKGLPTLLIGVRVGAAVGGQSRLLSLTGSQSSIWPINLPERGPGVGGVGAGRGKVLRAGSCPVESRGEKSKPGPCPT